MTRTASTWLLRGGLAVALGAMYFLESKPAELKPYSVQMHVHASMSEGSGSWRAANIHSKKIGLDVLWWSDHDWRISYHTYANGYDFEADGLSKTVPVPYLPGTDSSAAREQKMQITLSPSRNNGDVVDAVGLISAEQASQGKKSLEVAASAKPGDFQEYFYSIDSSRARMKRSLASRVRLNISIYPDMDPDKATMAGLRVQLSQQPPDMEQGAIYYVVTGLTDAELAAMSNAHLKYVRLESKPRQWNNFTLDLTKDATRLGLGGEDNALVDASFGVLTRGKRAHAFFDDYRISEDIKAEALMTEARRMAAAFQKEYGVINYVGQELSYEAHLNPLGVHIPMIDYVKHPAGLDGPETADFVHGNGGIASVNHIFGTTAPKWVNVKDPESVRTFEDRRIKELIANRCEHADLMEVGYPVRVLPMRSFLRVWDALSAAGVYIVGNGTSDTHSSNGGWYKGNNFVSWVYAPSPSQTDIIDGFRRGSVYFGDPVQFKGRVMLTTGDGHQMGQVVITKKPAHEVTVAIDGLPAGAHIRTVTAGKYGPDFTASGADFRQSVPVETAQATFFRVECYTADNKPLVFSNPIYFTPAEPSPKLSASKRTVCN